MPTLLTPGAAEALVVKAYRLSRTENLSSAAALEACLAGYQNPVPADVLEFQMRIAIREATDLAFVPRGIPQVRCANPDDMSGKRPISPPRSTRALSACRCRRTGSVSPHSRCSARS